MNKRQYDLNRTNAEISAYSSGDLPKYEYLTKKYLGYKPDAFEQANFEYSQLGKVFTDGLDKCDRNEGLLKRLENIEDRNNNQLLALRNIYIPTIRNRYNGDDDDHSDDDDNNDDYILSEILNKNVKKGTLDLSVNKEVYNIIKKSKNLECKMYFIADHDKLHPQIFKNDYQKIIDKYDNKEISKKDIKNMIDNVIVGIKFYEELPNTLQNKLNIDNTKELFKGLKEIYDGIKNRKITVGTKIISDSGKSIDMSWMNDFLFYKRIAKEVKNKYKNNKQSTELTIIQLFIDDINNEHMKSKKDMKDEFKTVKKKNG